MCLSSISIAWRLICYRSLKEIPVSILGFGAMRLPLIGGTEKPTDSFDPARVIDEEETTQMIEYAIDHAQSCLSYRTTATEKGKKILKVHSAESACTEAKALYCQG